MKVVIEIEIDNDTMEDWVDVRQALELRIGAWAREFGSKINAEEVFSVYDDNGNRVGSVKVVD